MPFLQGRNHVICVVAECNRLARFNFKRAPLLHQILVVHNDGLGSNHKAVIGKVVLHLLRFLARVLLKK